MLRRILTLSLVVFLSGCGVQKNINAGNVLRTKMAESLTQAIIAVGESPNASDDLALGFLIGTGSFNVQNADTFKDYASGAGMFLREVLPFAQLFVRPSNSYDGAVFKAGGNILFDSNFASDDGQISDWTQAGSEQAQSRDKVNETME